MLLPPRCGKVDQEPPTAAAAVLSSEPATKKPLYKQQRGGYSTSGGNMGEAMKHVSDVGSQRNTIALFFVYVRVAFFCLYFRKIEADGSNMKKKT